MDGLLGEPSKAGEPSESAFLEFLSPSSKPGILGHLGDYEIDGIIAIGGMGVVYRAHEPELGTHGRDKNAFARFRRQRRGQGALSSRGEGRRRHRTPQRDSHPRGRPLDRRTAVSGNALHRRGFARPAVAQMQRTSAATRRGGCASARGLPTVSPLPTRRA